MIGLLRSHREKIPFLGEILFSLLTFPAVFTFMEKWMKDPKEPGTAAWLCAFYVTLGLVHLFRAFRLRGRVRWGFAAHLAYAGALTACGLLAVTAGITRATFPVMSGTFLACMLVERVLDILRSRQPWRIVCNAAVIVMLCLLSVLVPNEEYSMRIVGLVASPAALLSIMGLIFSHIRTDILREIVRKTYAIEIIGGLLVMMVAFSNVLTFTDDAFHSFWDALWYCFAVVTTIGFGDLTPASEIGRFLTIILGGYGIVVVALITSIIVNFYGEVKKTESK